MYGWLTVYADARTHRPVPHISSSNHVIKNCLLRSYMAVMLYVCERNLRNGIRECSKLSRRYAMWGKIQHVKQKLFDAFLFTCPSCSKDDIDREVNIMLSRKCFELVWQQSMNAKLFIIRGKDAICLN